MRGRKKITVEVGEETRSHLDSLLEEIHALGALVEELRAKATEIAEEIHGTLTAVLEDVDGAYNGTAGEQAAKRIADSYDDEGEALEALKDKVNGEHPFPTGPSYPIEGLTGNVRSGPFTRVPRHIQVQWLLEVVLVDGDWHSAMEIARAEANDERHFRYLRGAISGRLREMWEEGLLDRRDAVGKGSMYDYRLKQ